MATNTDPGRGPRAMTDGYSMSGSQAKSVALNPAGTFSGGKRFSVSGPVLFGSPAELKRRLSRTTEQDPICSSRRGKGFMASDSTLLLGRWQRGDPGVLTGQS